MLKKCEDNDAAPLQLENSGHARLRGLSRYTEPLVASWREFRFAKKAGLLALNRLQRLRIEKPELTRQALYEAFVCQHNAIEASAARGILQRAEASFATWPNDRDLIFRDVVQYLAISEYLALYPSRGGTTVNMVRIISKIIPGNL
jgi:hypothetical protein